MILDLKKEVGIFSKIKNSDLSDFQFELKELNNLFGALVVNENTVESLYFLYLNLSADKTLWGFSIVDGRLVEKQAGYLVQFFQSFTEKGFSFPKRKMAMEVFIQLCDKNIGTDDLCKLLKTNLLERCKLDQVRQLKRFHQPNLVTFITIHDAYSIDLKCDEGKRISDLVFKILKRLDTEKIDEFTAHDLYFFIQKILPQFVKRLSTQISVAEIYSNISKMINWFLVWKNHLHQSEGEPPEVAAYYETDFPTIIKYVTEYLWWNNGFKYQKKQKVFAFGSQEFYFLAIGGSIRKVPNHHAYTRRMAREFVGLRYDLNLGNHEDMYLYLYVKSLGGGEQLSRLLMEYISHPNHKLQLKATLDKWNPVIQKLSDDDFETMNEERAKTLLGYLYHCLRDKVSFSVQRRPLEDLIRESNVYYERIAQRNRERIARQQERAAAWERRLDNHERRPSKPVKMPDPLSWKKHSSIKPHSLRTKGQRPSEGKYQIIELINEIELVKEGTNLRHCVAGYARQCINRSCSIWSLRKVLNGHFQSVVTIEISRNRTIVQMRGRMNSKPSAEEEKIILDWAARQRIQVDD